MLSQVLKSVVKYTIMVIYAGVPVFLLIYLILGAMSRLRRLWPLAYPSKTFFGTHYPSIESYGYRAIHGELYERMLESLSWWQRTRFRFSMLCLVLAAMPSSQFLKTKALAKGIGLLRSQYDKADEERTLLLEEDLQEVVVTVLFHLRNRDIDVAQRYLKCIVLNSNLKALDSNTMLSLLLFNQLLQDIESAEILFNSNTEEKRRETEEACRRLEQTLERFYDIRGKCVRDKHAIYDEILLRYREHQIYG